MVPMLEVMKEPTLPAMIIEIKVGANSKTMDCLVAKPTKYFGMMGLVMFKAGCIVTTTPKKNEIKARIPNDPILRSSMSLKIRVFITDHLVGLGNMSLIIIK